MEHKNILFSIANFSDNSDFAMLWYKKNEKLLIKIIAIQNRFWKLNLNNICLSNL